MENIRQYLLNVVIASLLAGALSAFIGTKSTAGKTIKTISSLFLAMTLYAPLIKIDFGSVLNSLSIDAYNADAIIEDGKQAARESYDALIIEQTQAYILDEASAYGATVDVTVDLDDGDLPVPCRVIIVGEVSPYVKEHLSTWMTENLDITRENQIWK